MNQEFNYLRYYSVIDNKDGYKDENDLSINRENLPIVVFLESNYKDF